MPWIRTADVIPPKNVELVLFKNGKRWNAKLGTYDIVNGHGGLNPDLPEFWSYPLEKELPDPEFKLKGIDHIDTQVIDESVRPKLDPNGKEPEIKTTVRGHDGYVGE